ncbi:hypothetical protein Mapa_012759 [Marchantia paleacea]|nr:hypothetical protein Mapa_012759 [Marchantia paleacea]
MLMFCLFREMAHFLFFLFRQMAVHLEVNAGGIRCVIVRMRQSWGKVSGAEPSCVLVRLPIHHTEGDAGPSGGFESEVHVTIVKRGCSIGAGKLQWLEISDLPCYTLDLKLGWLCGMKVVKWRSLCQQCLRSWARVTSSGTQPGLTKVMNICLPCPALLDGSGQSGDV